MDSHVQSLEDELRSTRVRLHTTVEELETANEELKSSNEEMMSMNEELQSTNEELSTVNDELKSKVDELSVANADLSNFFASTALPLVVVDSDMSIRNFTDAIQSIYPFRGTDRGRPLSEVTSSLRNNEEVLTAARDVMDDGEVRYLRVADRAEERTWSLVITPTRTAWATSTAPPWSSPRSPTPCASRRPSSTRASACASRSTSPRSACGNSIPARTS